MREDEGKVFSGKVDRTVFAVELVKVNVPVSDYAVVDGIPIRHCA